MYEKVSKGLPRKTWVIHALRPRCAPEYVRKGTRRRRPSTHTNITTITAEPKVLGVGQGSGDTSPGRRIVSRGRFRKRLRTQVLNVKDCTTRRRGLGLPYTHRPSLQLTLQMKEGTLKPPLGSAMGLPLFDAFVSQLRPQNSNTHTSISEQEAETFRKVSRNTSVSADCSQKSGTNGIGAQKSVKNGVGEQKHISVDAQGECDERINPRGSSKISLKRSKEHSQKPKRFQSKVADAAAASERRHVNVLKSRCRESQRQFRQRNSFTFRSKNEATGQNLRQSKTLMERTKPRASKFGVRFRRRQSKCFQSDKRIVQFTDQANFSKMKDLYGGTKKKILIQKIKDKREQGQKAGVAKNFQAKHRMYEN